jgi:hypothetical protein
MAALTRIERLRARFPKRIRIWLDCHVSDDPMWRLIAAEADRPAR